MTLFLTKQGKPVSQLAEFTSVQTAFLYFYDSVLQSLFKQQREHLSCKCYCYCTQDVIAGWADSPLWNKFACFFFQMKLWNKYKVTSIPSLVFVDAATGKVVCRNGLLVVRDDPKGEIVRRASTFSRGTEVIFDLNPWTQAPVIKLWKCCCLLRG